MREKSNQARDYTTGRVARELRVSPSHPRALCQAGLIAARATRGGHWRIPKSEVERLRKEGVPEPPPATPIETEAEPAGAPPSIPHRHPALLAEPSRGAIASADEVVCLANEVKALGLKREKEENLDWFRERQRKENEIEAAHKRQVLEVRARRVSEEWGNSWLEYALQCVPDGAPRDVLLPVSESVRAALATLSPNDSEELVEELVCAAVERGIGPWQRAKETEAGIQQARNQLPYSARGYGSPSEWELRATRAAADAISQLRERTTVEEIRAAAIHAARQVASEFEHRERCQMMVGGVFLPNAPEQQGDARRAVQAALNELPIGASWADVQKARDAALAPFKATDDAAGAQAKAGRDADLYLTRVDSYLEKIAASPQRRPEMKTLSDRSKIGRRLKNEIRPILIAEILEEPLSLDDAYSLVESLVERRL